MAQPCILLVEDEFLIRLLLAESLAEAGFKVVEAVSGEAAIGILSRGDPVDLVLTDISMTGAVDGNEVARAAKTRVPGVPVIYATGRPDSLTNAVGREDALIRKPYSPGQLMVTIRRLLESSAG